MKIFKCVLFFISLGVFGLGTGVSDISADKSFMNAIGYAFLSIAIMIGWSEFKHRD